MCLLPILYLYLLFMNSPLLSSIYSSISKSSIPIPSIPKSSISEPSISKPSIPIISIPKSSISEPSISKSSISEPSISKSSISEPSISKPSIPITSISKPSIPITSISKPSIPITSISIPSIPITSISEPSISEPSIYEPPISKSFIFEPPISELLISESLISEPLINSEQIDKTIINIKYKHILVMSGGGIKGIAHLGALKALDDLNYLIHIDTIAGTSVGALIGCLLCIGYSPIDLFEFILYFDINLLKSVNPSNLLSSFGLDDGKNFILVLHKLFQAKYINSDITFSDLFKLSKKKLIVSASCINDKKIYYFSHLSHPDMSVLLAIRMSISIPLYFIPVLYDNKLFIDGGCIDNYPIQLFIDDLDNVIGIYVSSVPNETINIINIEDFLINTLHCLFESVVCNSLKGFEKYSIKIFLNYTYSIDLNNINKHSLFDNGYNSVLSFFSPV